MEDSSSELSVQVLGHEKILHISSIVVGLGICCGAWTGLALLSLLVFLGLFRGFRGPIKARRKDPAVSFSAFGKYDGSISAEDSEGIGFEYGSLLGKRSARNEKGDWTHGLWDSRAEIKGNNKKGFDIERRLGFQSYKFDGLGFQSCKFDRLGFQCCKFDRLVWGRPVLSNAFYWVPPSFQTSPISCLCNCNFDKSLSRNHSFSRYFLPELSVSSQRFIASPLQRRLVSLFNLERDSGVDVSWIQSKGLFSVFNNEKTTLWDADSAKISTSFRANACILHHSNRNDNATVMLSCGFRKNSCIYLWDCRAPPNPSPFFFSSLDLSEFSQVSWFQENKLLVKDCFANNFLIDVRMNLPTFIPSENGTSDHPPFSPAAFSYHTHNIFNSGMEYEKDDCFEFDDETHTAVATSCRNLFTLQHLNRALRSAVPP